MRKVLKRVSRSGERRQMLLLLLGRETGSQASDTACVSQLRRVEPGSRPN